MTNLLFRCIKARPVCLAFVDRRSFVRLEVIILAKTPAEDSCKRCRFEGVETYSADVVVRFARALTVPFAFVSPPFPAALPFPFFFKFCLSVPVDAGASKSEAFNFCELLKDVDVGAVVLLNH